MPPQGSSWRGAMTDGDLRKYRHVSQATGIPPPQNLETNKHCLIKKPMPQRFAIGTKVLINWFFCAVTISLFFSHWLAFQLCGEPNNKRKLECDTFYPISGSYFSYHKVALENAQAMMRIVLLTNPLKLDLTLVGYCKNSYSYQPEMNIGTYLHGCNAHEWNFFKVEKSALNCNVCNIIGYFGT